MRGSQGEFWLVAMPLIWSNGGVPLLLAFLPLYLYALIKGDKTDLDCGHVLALSALISFTFRLNPGKPAQVWPFAAEQFGVESLLLAAQIAIALRTRRFYPLVMAAAQLLIVIAGALSMARLIGKPKTLMMIFAGTSLIQFGAFACGVIARRRPHRTANLAPIKAR